MDPLLEGIEPFMTECVWSALEQGTVTQKDQMVAGFKSRQKEVDGQILEIDGKLGETTSRIADLKKQLAGLQTQLNDQKAIENEKR